MMDLTINNYQKQLIETIRKLSEQEIKPFCLKKDFSKTQAFDWHLVKLLGELNLVCPTIPVEYGGLGLDMFTIGLIIEEISVASPSLAAIVETNVHFAQPIILAGSNYQKETILPKLTGTDACLSSFALTEVTGGSDVKSMMTCARKISNGFILNGRKEYILNAPEAEYILLFAFTDPLHKKSSLRGFIIPRTISGLRIGHINEMAVLDYAQMAEIIFDHIEIGPDMILKETEPYSGYFLLTQTMDIGRVLTAATAVGIARAAYEIAFDFSNQRIQFDRKIRNHQAVSHSLVDMATKIEMARLMTWKACWLIDQGDDYTIASAMAKLSASAIAQEVTAAASNILGAKALIKGSFMDRLTNDARMLSTIEGTNNILRNIIASLL